MPNLSAAEIILVAFFIVLVFGARRVPEIGRSVGRGLREFKLGVTQGGGDEPPEDAPSDRRDAPRA